MPELSPTVYLGRRVVRYAPTYASGLNRSDDFGGLGFAGRQRWSRLHIRAPLPGENAGHARVLHQSLGFRPCLSD